MAEALRKRKPDGTLYTRMPATETDLQLLGQLSRDEILARCEVRQRTDARFVSSECLLHLVRASRADNSNAWFERLYKILYDRVLRALPRAEAADGETGSLTREQIRERVSFATNDERTAKRVSDALGTATEMRAMKNYAGHRLSPWLGHLMVSRQETARALLTPGEVMQLPPDDELVLVSGCNPIRAKKARYYGDPRLQARVLEPPTRAGQIERSHKTMTVAPGGAGEWATVVIAPAATAPDDVANGGIRREPEIAPEQDIAPEWPSEPTREFELDDIVRRTDPRVTAFQHRSLSMARQVVLDPADDMRL